jgi:hypothetical protein
MVRASHAESVEAIQRSFPVIVQCRRLRHQLLLSTETNAAERLNTMTAIPFLWDRRCKLEHLTLRRSPTAMLIFVQVHPSYIDVLSGAASSQPNLNDLNI